MIKRGGLRLLTSGEIRLATELYGQSIALCFASCLLMGCVGDRLAFHDEGNAVVNADRICISSSPGDTLEYYLLSSSVNHYAIPLATEDNIVRKYPDTCIAVNLKEDANYTLNYVLNGQNYRFEFTTDARKHVTKTYSKL